MSLTAEQRLVLTEVFKAWLKWEFKTPNMREMVRRPYFLSNGSATGELLYHAPEAMR